MTAIIYPHQPYILGASVTRFIRRLGSEGRRRVSQRVDEIEEATVAEMESLPLDLSEERPFEHHAPSHALFGTDAWTVPSLLNVLEHVPLRWRLEALEALTDVLDR
jgi:hypothetical protein